VAAFVLASLGSIPSIPVNIQKSSGNWPYLIAAHQFILNLKDYPNFSVVIPIVTNKTEASFSELLNELLRARQIGRSFHVKAPSGYRVMATIQELKLNDPDIFVAQAKEDSCMENYLQVAILAHSHPDFKLTNELDSFFFKFYSLETIWMMYPKGSVAV
jgi:hypothetical protein